MQILYNFRHVKLEYLAADPQESQRVCSKLATPQASVERPDLNIILKTSDLSKILGSLLTARTIDWNVNLCNSVLFFYTLH